MKKFNPAVADQSRKLIGEFFRNRRKELGLTIAELAEVAGIKVQTILVFEKGNRNITIDNLIVLCGCLRIRPFFETVEDVNNEVPGFGKVDLN